MHKRWRITSRSNGGGAGMGGWGVTEPPSVAKDRAPSVHSPSRGRDAMPILGKLNEH